MALFVTDCPRCDSKLITFDVEHVTFMPSVGRRSAELEFFAICRRCKKGSIFEGDLHVDRGTQLKHLIERVGLKNFTDSINPAITSHRPVSLADVTTEDPPQYVPDEILNAFVEGQKTLAIGCSNASGAMSRLTLDLATKQMLAPYIDSPDVTKRIKENLNERLVFLIRSGAIPKSLEELAHHVRLEGNDAAHDGALNERDARDLIEFCHEFLRACFEQPGNVAEAKKRREARHQT